MRELTFVGLSDDGVSLVLSSTDGTCPSRMWRKRPTSGASAKDISTASARGSSTGRPKYSAATTIAAITVVMNLGARLSGGWGIFRSVMVRGAAY